MSRIYISDTNIWIDFENASLLTELFQLSFELCCTDFVFNELPTTTKRVLKKHRLLVESVDAGSMVTLFELMARHNNSSLADVSCYFIAQMTGRPLLTGDKRLRTQAETDGVEVFGALWLLDKLVEESIIASHQAAEALELMITQGARLPQQECNRRIAAWKLHKK
jgi:predicted nucleic acid-binding protein